MILLLAYLALALGVSFLCSLLESVLLSVPRAHVALLVERASPAGDRLQRMKADLDQPLAAILTLNTFAHTLGAAGVGAQAAHIWGDASVGVVSFILTLLILVFSEIVPKTLGAVHAKALSPFAASTIGALITLLRPIVAVCNWLSRILSRTSQAAPGISRDEVASLARVAHEEGAIDRDEAVVIRNLIALRDTAVEQIMTPRPVVFSLRADQTVGEAIADEPPRFARIPIIRSSLDDAIGVIHRHDLFKALADRRTDATLAQLARPMHVLPEVARLSQALRQFIQRRQHMFRVVDEYGSSVGVVTLEDVLETLLGADIVDETDAVADMRQLARRLLQTRHQSHHEPERPPE